MNSGGIFIRIVAQLLSSNVSTRCHRGESVPSCPTPSIPPGGIWHLQFGHTCILHVGLFILAKIKYAPAPCEAPFPEIRPEGPHPAPTGFALASLPAAGCPGWGVSVAGALGCRRKRGGRITRDKPPVPASAVVRSVSTCWDLSCALFLRPGSALPGGHMEGHIRGLGVTLLKFIFPIQ